MIISYSGEQEFTSDKCNACGKIKWVYGLSHYHYCYLCIKDTPAFQDVAPYYGSMVQELFWQTQSAYEGQNFLIRNFHNIMEYLEK